MDQKFNAAYELLVELIGNKASNEFDRDSCKLGKSDSLLVEQGVFKAFKAYNFEDLRSHPNDINDYFAENIVSTDAGNLVMTKNAYLNRVNFALLGLVVAVKTGHGLLMLECTKELNNSALEQIVNTLLSCGVDQYYSATYYFDNREAVSNAIKSVATLITMLNHAPEVLLVDNGLHSPAEALLYFATKREGKLLLTSVKDYADVYKGVNKESLRRFIAAGAVKEIFKLAPTVDALEPLYNVLSEEHLIWFKGGTYQGTQQVGYENEAWAQDLFAPQVGYENEAWAQDLFAPKASSAP